MPKVDSSNQAKEAVAKDRDPGFARLDQVRMLARLMDSLALQEDEIRELAQRQNEKLVEMLISPVAPGAFYTLSFKEHAIMLFVLAGKVDKLKEFGQSPELIEDFVNAEQVDEEIPEWLANDDEQVRKAQFFMCFYTLSKTITAIREQGVSINEMLQSAIDHEDMAMLKLAIKFDPLVLSCPIVSALLALEDLTSGKTIRLELASALKRPYKRPYVAYGKLRYIVRSLHDEGLLDDMSEEERYKFLVEELQLYPAEGTDSFGNFNRFIRRLEKKFRTQVR